MAVTLALARRVAVGPLAVIAALYAAQALILPRERQPGVVFGVPVPDKLLNGVLLAAAVVTGGWGGLAPAVAGGAVGSLWALGALEKSGLGALEIPALVANAIGTVLGPLLHEDSP